MVTDQNLLNEVQSLLGEPQDGGITWPSRQWTQAEMVGYANDAQQEILADTAAILLHATLPATPHLLRHALPEGWIATQRAVWKRASDGRRFVLSRGDLWELNNAISDWKYQPGIPKLFTDADTPSLTIQIAPAPAVPGVLDLLYLGIPTHYTGAGIASDVPDDTTVGIVWEVIQHALTQEGRGKDVVRAAAAQAKADLVRDALRLILQGWEA
jgi:hypothetical protein